MDDLVGDPFYLPGGNPLSANLIAELEDGSHPGIGELVELLRLLDYDLAIAPKRFALALSDADPWAEFR